MQKEASASTARANRTNRGRVPFESAPTTKETPHEADHNCVGHERDGGTAVCTGRLGAGISTASA